MKTVDEYMDIAHASDLKWRKALEFYKDEIAHMLNMLSEVSQKNTSSEVRMMVSHFESQFTINKEVIAELKHEINLREDFIASDLKKNVVAYEHRIIHTHMDMKGRMLVFEKLFTELKKQFNRFLSEIM